MDFRKLSRAFDSPPHATTNSTSAWNTTELPPNILEALIPGYSIISRYASLYFGLDISLFVTIGLIFLAVTKGFQYVYGYIERWFEYWCMSSVYIDEHDDLFDMVMGWLAAHQESTTRSRKMRAKTQRGSGKDETFDATADDALDENGFFNYTKWSARTPPRFEPYYGRQFVWHDGKIFWFRRSRRSNEGQRLQVNFGNAPEDDVIQLDCIGRSIEPIKDLLRTIRIWSLNRTRHTTTIRHPTPKDRARFGGTWSKTSSRPSRPMDTVILDTEQKDRIIQDMNEYLHPASPRWYATRGIPYRRGYLFFGPPGTGKTSLSFALAGIFGLEIYAISLQEPTLSEGDLMQLFNGLPRRCIVLLEDVDAAGLIRDMDSDDAPKTKKKDASTSDGTDKKAQVNGVKDEKTAKHSENKSSDDDFTLKDLAKELKALAGSGAAGPGRGNRGFNQDRGNNAANNRAAGGGISLSGLLNAIDGVATHEGRVLIMTTNHPEKLDAALIRPGRVDRKVEFRLAMKEQVRELFVRMYAASEMEADSTPKGAAPAASVASLEGDLAHMSRAELEKLAAEFASHVPDDTFTPAEVQNLLMRHKKEPQTAVDEVEAWVKTTLAEKEVQNAEEETGEDDNDHMRK